MALSKELEEMLAEWELTPEERAVVEPVIGKPERVEKVGKGRLRLSEFSRKMDALAEQEKTLKAAIAEKERLIAEDATALGNWKQTADKTIQDTAKALEDEKVKHYKLQQRMQNLAAQYGVDPKELGVEEPVKPSEPPKTEPNYDDRYLSKAEAERIEKELRTSPFIAAELEDIVDEHRGLFNKGLNRRELVMAAFKNKRSLRDEWEEQNKVSDRRKELQEREIEERIKSKVDEERTKILSEHKLPVTRGAEHGSPLLSMRDDLKLAGIDRSKSTGASAVDAAVAAYNTGKYRQPETKTG